METMASDITPMEQHQWGVETISGKVGRTIGATASTLLCICLPKPLVDTQKRRRIRR